MNEWTPPPGKGGTIMSQFGLLSFRIFAGMPVSNVVTTSATGDFSRFRNLDVPLADISEAGFGAVRSLLLAERGVIVFPRLDTVEAISRGRVAILEVKDGDIDRGTRLERAGSVCRMLRRADVLLTRSPNIALAMFGADCPPILLAAGKPSKSEGAVGVFHGGWRLVVSDMIPKALKKLRRWGFAPENVHIGIGPGICERCFEVGKEVVEQFRQILPEQEYPTVYSSIDGRPHLDLHQAIAERFFLEGVHHPRAGECCLPSQIEKMRLCTACGYHNIDDDGKKFTFPSHRRNGSLARFIAAINQCPS